MQAVILAGGKGTRLRAEVADLPKPLAPVNGRPFLAYLMSYWVGQGVDRFVLSVGYMAGKVIEEIGDRFDDVPVDYAVEDRPLGTGGGLFLAMGQLRIGEPFLVLNGDTFFDLPLSDLRSLHEARSSDWTLGLFRTNDTKRYMGVGLDTNDRLTSLVGPAGAGVVWANGGVYLISPGVLEPIAGRFKGEVSLEGEIIPALLDRKSSLHGFRHGGAFIDIGLPADYRRAANILEPAVLRFGEATKSIPHG
ncbi:sugar phosphate nucleotidyltransferase [Bradyrhizobium sp.]|uniref:sugar phosphate nucleotidyltransferase n=1 Tax=Bradyrhizobium sp. TaxID=376 RepID=UPI002607CC3B|nr:sugar phosphate nucleotidyltransferase [Bradyrhizobium sp.]